MIKLQPKSKSFEHYIYIGFKFATKKNLNIVGKKLLKNISCIDDSILIIDDIIDKSKLRNGKSCLYLQIGEEGAILKSKLLEIEARNNLLNLALLLKTKEEFKIKIINKFDDFLRDIYLGEEIGQRLSKQKKYSDFLLKNYFKMITLFTGGHIKYSVEIGQLLANKEPDSRIGTAAASSGIIRQIIDDFNDYFKKHHEPFGDFLSESNRLPEILFKKFGGNRKKALNLIERGDIIDFLSMVLNKKVREEIVKYCDKEVGLINKKVVPIDDYAFILDK
ncbi:MAG: polyprenyl synthetase family protein [Patescibacteria group bacterium]|jgi:geranylgeranyl pyrophosphate synthase